MSRARLWPRIAERMSAVSPDELRQGESISSSRWGWITDWAKLRALMRACPENVANVTPISAISAEHAQDQDQDDPPALSAWFRCVLANMVESPLASVPYRRRVGETHQILHGTMVGFTHPRRSPPSIKLVREILTDRQ